MVPKDGNRAVKIMLSAGSRVTKSNYPVMRKAGAQARHVLLHTAAKHWDAPIEALHTENGFVLYDKTDQKISYGELVPFLEVPETLPDFQEDQLKDPKNFRLIGKDIPRYEIPEKVNGAAKFAIDLQLPDMLYGVLERGNLHGAKPVLQNESEILAMEGILKIVPFEYAIGIVATTLEQALAAKKQLKIDWSEATSTGYNSQDIFDEYEKVASQTKKGEVMPEIGNVQQAFRNPAKTYSADFKNDYVYHAQMEPLNSIVKVAEDGKSAEVWVGTQQGGDTKLGVPDLLGIPAKDVNVHLQYLGGGFGRRSMTDFVVECAALAKEMAPKPVKLMWTREDDMTYGAYRPLSLQRLTASTDSKGNITGLSHIVVAENGNLATSGVRNDYYDIPNQLVDWRETTHGIRLKHWRAVGHGPNKFAIECLLDDVAHDQKIDPVTLRRKLMSKSPRALATLEKAAEISEWDSTSIDGKAKGVAFLERSGTLSTGVCEISVDRNTGKINVHRFWSAIDAGVIVQPDNVKAQMEGGIIMGMSSVLKEQLTMVDGKVQQSNFDTYQLLRMEDIPDSIETAMIESNEPPQGVGESGTPLVACAIANAFLSLTGKRLRHLPFTPERVLEALNS
ncbi:xanthine dehydrogenase family protein molybdopterin-binding subunit [Maribacter halichondriae]|uniref:xanthine dehydrogenase family protein molybdopterin-binding subunit n=1 Tax=Maribacter halichondriae TaxID=2980554 RepID=UPI0023599213|nr:molybdopterin cofactor-binding domain-containing protein [Maribacter sp. Hal144]